MSPSPVESEAEALPVQKEEIADAISPAACTSRLLERLSLHSRKMLNTVVIGVVGIFAEIATGVVAGEPIPIAFLQATPSAVATKLAASRIRKQMDIDSEKYRTLTGEDAMNRLFSNGEDVSGF